jgi:hypothetical protein
MNASRIDNVELILELQDELAAEQVQIVVFGRNWNIFRYREGLNFDEYELFVFFITWTEKQPALCKMECTGVTTVVTSSSVMCSC